MSARAAVLAELRERIAQIAPPKLQPRQDNDGVGWPRPGVLSVRGPAGSGRYAVVRSSLVALAKQERIAIVDPMSWIYPPGLGLPFERVLLVRPGWGRECWAAEQLLRSGALSVVLLVDPGPLGRSARRLQHAAEAGNATLVLLHDEPITGLRVDLGWRIERGRAVQVRG